MNHANVIPSVLLVVTLGLVSCQPSPEPVDATKPLAQAFELAQPEAKQAIQTVITCLKSGDYMNAVKSLTSVVTSNSNLTPPQLHAASLALQQVNQAVGANPALDSKEMHEQRTRLAEALVERYEQSRRQ